MFSNFDEETRQIIVTAKSEMKNLKHPYVGSEHLLLSVLKRNNIVSKKLKKYNITYERFKTELVNIVGVGTIDSDLFLFTPLLKRVFETASIDSKEDGVNVSIEYLFKALLEEGDGIAIRILISMGIDIDELESSFVYSISSTSNKSLLIEELGYDLTSKAKRGEVDPVYGRELELNRIIEILSRRCKNNPILIGDAGVGKTAIVEELSRMIVNGNVPLNLKDKRIISLDMASLVAGTKYRGEFEDKIKKVLMEVEENKNIILFIDEIHTLVGAGGAEGAIDASNIIKPALARGSIRCIGATTINEYKDSIECDRALDRRFQKVLIKEPSLDEAKNILKNLKTIYENYHSVKIKDDVIDYIIEMSNKYIHDRSEPDRSLDILDEVCARVSIKDNKKIKQYSKLKTEYNSIISKKEESIIKSEFDLASTYKDKENIIADKLNKLELNLYKKENKKVTKDDVLKVISIKTNIPISKLDNSNYKKIEELRETLNKNIMGQDKAIDELIRHIKKVQFGFNDNRCYSYLFVGPSGVGKTMLAKTYANYITNNVIKLDMTEYSEAHSVSKIIGSPPGYVGYDSYTNILESIRLNPYSVLILDEIERAHPDVLNLFFNILDEGSIKDSRGRVIRFDNVTIIMTSNVGFDDIHVGFKTDKSVISSRLKDYFSIPFINRIDNTIVFDSIDNSCIEKIIKLKINNLLNKYNSYNISINDAVIEELKELSNYEEFGVRKVDRIIKDRILSKIVDDIIDGKSSIKVDSIMEKTA